MCRRRSSTCCGSARMRRFRGGRWRGSGTRAGAAAARSLSEPLLIQTGKPIHMVNQGREPVAKGPMSSVVASGMHYIREADRREELYLLASDPEEVHDLAGSPMAAADPRGIAPGISVAFPGP